MEENIIRDDSDDKSYFTISPRIVWAVCKNVYEYTLWGVVKDIAGDNGECYVSTKNLAVLAMMSTGKVSEARKRLLKSGLLRGEMKKVGNGQSVWHLSVPNLWPANVEFVAENRSIAERVEHKKQQRLHAVKPSPGETKPSPGETKNIPKEEQITTPLTLLAVGEEEKEKPLSSLADDSYAITYHFKNKDHVRAVGNWTNGPWAVKCLACGNDVHIDQIGVAAECLCGMHEFVLTKITPEGKIKRGRNAVEVYLLISGRKRRSIAHEWLDDITTTVTDIPFWRQVVKEWCGLGWNRGNISKMLDYYRERKIPGTRQKLTPDSAKPKKTIIDGVETLVYEDEKKGPKETIVGGRRTLVYD